MWLIPNLSKAVMFWNSFIKDDNYQRGINLKFLERIILSYFLGFSVILFKVLCVHNNFISVHNCHQDFSLSRTVREDAKSWSGRGRKKWNNVKVFTYRINSMFQEQQLLQRVLITSILFDVYVICWCDTDKEDHSYIRDSSHAISRSSRSDRCGVSLRWSSKIFDTHL